MTFKVKGYRPGRLAHSTLITLFWQIVRIGLLALWMFVTARLLGPDGYGTYSGIASLALTLGAFTGLGLGFVMYQGTVHKPESFSLLWSNAVTGALLSGALITPLFLVLGSTFVPEARFGTLLAIGLSEVLLFPLVTTSAFAFSAHERLGWATMLPAITALYRLAANVAFYYFIQQRSVDQYVWFHIAATLFAAITAVALTHKILAPRKTSPALTRANIIEGFGFAFSWSGSNAMTSLDKTFALKFGGPEIAGIYSIAYRFVTLVTQPMDALVAAALPRLFAQGADAAQHPRLLPMLIGAILAYGLLAGLLVWLAADLLPLLLGQEFTPTVHTIQALSIVIPFYGFRVAASHALIGHKRKRVKSLIELLAVLLMAAFSMALIPRHGALGAAYAYILVEAFLAAATALALSQARLSPKMPLKQEES